MAWMKWHADAVAVAVPAGDDHLERCSPAWRRGHRDRAAVQAVHAVGVDETGQVRRATDAGDQQTGPSAQTRLSRAHLDGLQDAEISASRTPVRIDNALKTVNWQFYDCLPSFPLVCCTGILPVMFLHGLSGRMPVMPRAGCPCYAQACVALESDACQE